MKRSVRSGAVVLPYPAQYPGWPNPRAPPHAKRPKRLARTIPQAVEHPTHAQSGRPSLPNRPLRQVGPPLRLDHSGRARLRRLRWLHRQWYRRRQRQRGALCQRRPQAHAAHHQRIHQLHAEAGCQPNPVFRAAIPLRRPPRHLLSPGDTRKNQHLESRPKTPHA